MTIRRRHWLAALAVAVLVHASMLTVLWEPTKSGAANLGVGGVEIDFGVAGGAPGGPQDVPPPTAEAVEPPEAAASELAAETETVEVAETVTTPPPEVPVQEVAAAEPVAVEETAVEPVEVVEVETKTADVRMPKKPRPPEPEPVQPKAVAPPPVEPATQPPPNVTPPKEVASRTPAPDALAEPPSVAGAAGKSGTKESPNVGAGENTSSGGRPGSADSYFARLQAWLEQHKEYPTGARRRRQEGTAILTFSFDREGRVMRARIGKSSGIDALDHEVLEMLRRAEPLPSFPDDFPQNQITLSVPVQFHLR